MKYFISEGWGEDASEAVESLEVSVQRQLDEGFLPVGGCCLVKTRDGYHASQAMIEG